jgi:pimeloyl-ACP methyl ester carboxylesterase
MAFTVPGRLAGLLRHARGTTALAWLAATLVAGCSSSGPAAPPAARGLAPGVHQQSTQSPVPDPVAGTASTRVAFTVFVPDTPGPHTLVLIGGGFGEGRTTALPGADNEPAASYWRRMQRQIPRLMARGHAVVSFDYRGHGDSGGDLRMLDPAADMQDLRAIIDWAERHLHLARRASSTRADDPLVATMGGSYGGAYQLLLAQLDSRIDAIVPTMTWSRLDHDLLPDQVVKSGWLQLECFLGQRGKVRDDGRFVRLCGLAKPPQPATLDAVAPGDARAYMDYLGGSGWQPWLRQAGRGAARPVDALLVQADEDVLFPLGDAFENYRSLQALGGDVRLVTVRAGHVNSLAGQKNQVPACGQAVPDAFDTMLDFLDEKLRNAPRKGLPAGTLCFATGERSAEWRADLPPDAGLDAPRVDLAGVEVAGTAPVFVPLRTPLPAGQVLLGAPRARLDIAGVQGSVALLGVGLRRAGQAPVLVSGQIAAVRPGTGREVVLPVVAQALQPGDELGVMLWPTHPQFQHMKSVAEAVPVGGVLPGNAVRVSGQVWLPVLRSSGPR